MDLHTLTLEQLTRFVTDYGNQDIIAVLGGFTACGFNFHLQRIACKESLNSSIWNHTLDQAMVGLANSLSVRQRVTADRIHPSEFYVSQDDAQDPQYACLSPIPIEHLTSRFAFHVAFNAAVERKVLPMVLQKASFTDGASLSSLLFETKNLIFTDTKTAYLRHIINSTAQRPADDHIIHVGLDPFCSLKGKGLEELFYSWFFQAMGQLEEVSSSRLCTPIASGGDPQYPFEVTMFGAHVNGASGTFRDFMSRVTEEMHSPVLGLLTPYVGPGPYKGRYMLRPGPMKMLDERLLKFMGLLMGVSIRSGIPMALNLAPCFWKGLEPGSEFTTRDLKRYDPATHNFLETIEAFDDEVKFENFLEEQQWPKFTYMSMDGNEEEICGGGILKYLSFSNRLEYTALVRKFKIRELESDSRFAHIRVGLAILTPIDLMLNLFSTQELEDLFCGSEFISLPYLRTRTIYQAGLTEDDEHIQFFWSALESFTQKELQRFVKFACNQDRLPVDLEGGIVPPFPMKIAPFPHNENDKANIRVETCMFLVSLPRYSTYEIMRSKILFATHSAFDPLIG